MSQNEFTFMTELVVNDIAEYTRGNGGYVIDYINNKFELRTKFWKSGQYIVYKTENTALRLNRRIKFLIEHVVQKQADGKYILQNIHIIINSLRNVTDVIINIINVELAKSLPPQSPPPPPSDIIQQNFYSSPIIDNSFGMDPSQHHYPHMNPPHHQMHSNYGQPPQHHYPHMNPPHHQMHSNYGQPPQHHYPHMNPPHHQMHSNYGQSPQQANIYVSPVPVQQLNEEMPDFQQQQFLQIDLEFSLEFNDLQPPTSNLEFYGEEPPSY